jgi:phosphate:Na+ symporter
MISNFNLLILAVSTISLFLYGLRSFSDEIKNNNALKFRERLSRFSHNRVSGFIVGGLLTAIIQSSSAVSGMAIAMVDAGVISLQQAFSVLLGSNLGTTATAWIVALNLSNIGPYFIIFGTFLSAMPIKAHLYGKAFFYFGFTLFSISLLSDYMAGFDRTEWEMEELVLFQEFWFTLLVGLVLTILLQSSSFVAGVLIVLAMHDLLTLHIAIGVIMGSNLGTTSTALYQSLRYTPNAKRGAYANFVFNLTGLIVFLPFLSLIESALASFDNRLYLQVAIFHTVYHVFIGLAFTPFIGKFTNWIQSKEIHIPLEEEFNKE